MYDVHRYPCTSYLVPARRTVMHSSHCRTSGSAGTMRCCAPGPPMPRQPSHRRTAHPKLLVVVVILAGGVSQVQCHSHFNFAESAAFIEGHQKNATDSARALIDTDTYTSLNQYQWTLSHQSSADASIYAKRPEAYSHIELWPTRMELDDVGILKPELDVPHHWACKSTHLLFPARLISRIRVGRSIDAQ